MKKINLTGLIFVWSAAFHSVFAQESRDTLRYTISGAEKVFLENNLPLLAEELNISQADARITQAKVWPNPTFTLDEIQLYKNSTTDVIPPLFGNFWRDRTFSAHLEQLVFTAGKRKKGIALEMRNKEMAQSVFADLLQSLKAEFRQTAAELRYLQQVQNGWVLQLAEVDKLLKAQQSQLAEGNISQAEMYRFKALRISLQGEINALGERMTEAQSALKTLMYIDPRTYVIIEEEPGGGDIARLKRHTLDELIALTDNNASLQAARTQVKISEAQLAIERANRVPDITFNANYDRNGSVMLNFVGVGFAMDIPMFNRNRGATRAALIEVQKSNLMEKNKVSELGNAVAKSWTDLNKSIQLYEAIDADYVEKLDDMTKAVARNFLQHNISLLEFLDFFESFRESKEKYYEAAKNIVVQKENLNYLIGSEL